MKKKGFTLVELLAVIAIIGVLAITIAPNVIDSFTSTKKQNFITETREVCREATNKYIRESVVTMDVVDYYRFNNDESHSLDLNGRKEFNYFIKLNTDGEVVGLLTWDGTYTIKIVNGNGIDPKYITESDLVTNIDTSGMSVTKANNILNN